MTQQEIKESITSLTKERDYWIHAYSSPYSNTSKEHAIERIESLSEDIKELLYMVE